MSATLSDRVCERCSEVRPTNEFYPNSKMADGLLRQCKACVLAKQRQRIASNRDAVCARRRERGARPEQKAKRRAAWQRWMLQSAPRWTAKARLYRRSHPDKIRAHNMVNARVRRGTMTRAAACQKCGVVGRTDAHHEDYSRPLDVKWFCRSCHLVEHRSEHGN